MGPTKGLGEKSHSISSSSIHILYNQALVRGLSVSYVPGTWIGNLQLHGGSITLLAVAATDSAYRRVPSCSTAVASRGATGCQGVYTVCERVAVGALSAARLVACM